MICVFKTVVYASLQKLHLRDQVPEVRGRTQLTQRVTYSKPVSFFFVEKVPEPNTPRNDHPLPSELKTLSFIFNVSI